MPVRRNQPAAAPRPFAHDVQHHAPGMHGHVLGPTLTPVNW